MALVAVLELPLVWILVTTRTTLVLAEETLATLWKRIVVRVLVTLHARELAVVAGELEVQTLVGEPLHSVPDSRELEGTISDWLESTPTVLHVALATIVRQDRREQTVGTGPVQHLVTDLLVACVAGSRQSLALRPVTHIATPRTQQFGHLCMGGGYGAGRASPVVDEYDDTQEEQGKWSQQEPCELHSPYQNLA